MILLLYIVVSLIQRKLNCCYGKTNLLKITNEFLYLTFKFYFMNIEFGSRKFRIVYFTIQIYKWTIKSIPKENSSLLCDNRPEKGIDA